MGTSKDTKRLGYRQLIYNIDNGKFFFELPGDQYQELSNIDDLPPLGNGWINVGPNVYYPADVLIGGIEGNIQLKASGDAVFGGSISCQTVTFGDGTTQTTAFGGDIGVVSVNDKTGVVTLTTNDLPNTAGFITLADLPDGGGGGDGTFGVTSVNGETGVVVLDIPDRTSDLINDSGFITLADVPSGGGGGGAVTSVNGQTGDVTIDTFSGDYTDLTNKPAIPTNNNQLLNGAGYITAADVPSIPSNTSDLTNDSGYITAADVPSIPSNTSDLTNDSGFITLADTFSGSYDDLTNKPTIPTDNAQLANGAGYITSADIPADIDLWQVSGSDIYYNTGNVGIGTAGPQVQLNVNKKVEGGLGPHLLLSNDSETAGTASRISFTSCNNLSRTAYIEGGNGDGTTRSDLRFGTGNGFEAVERMRITPTGNLGVANENPQARLHISSDELGTNLNDYNAIFKHSSGRNGNTDEFVIAEARREDAAGVVGNWTSSDFSIRRNVDNTGGQSFITFNGPRANLPMAVNLGVGNEAVPSVTATVSLVGINNTNPQYTLDINATSNPFRIVTPLEGGQHIINVTNTNPADNPTQFFVAHNGQAVQIGNARSGSNLELWSGGAANATLDASGNLTITGQINSAGFNLAALPELV